jgi:hypothetical protein
MHRLRLICVLDAMMTACTDQSVRPSKFTHAFALLMAFSACSVLGGISLAVAALVIH